MAAVMSLSLRQMFLFVTVVAIAWAQTAGIHRGYLCECGGTAELTAADHCHGPHSEACHGQEICPDNHEAVPHHHDSSEDKQDHPAVKESLIARHDQGAQVIVGLPLAQQADFVWISGAALSPWQHEMSLTPNDPWYRPDRLLRDAWPQRLAHTIALRI
jgi:hypothetical protein